ncbi:MAG: type II toxin-antitoxin system RelB/DinJ family antitoxin [Burkholderiales bacterium]|jgi:DNA-damage-inducible protein J|nr:type II toxin-antitoxin system RelB/DinJ family antitoxin [Burkholderiales bacterium]
MANAVINIRMDENIKRDAEALFGELGLNMSTAVNIFIRQTIRQRKIPFEISIAPDSGDPVRPPFQSGHMKGKVRMGDDFNAPLDDFKEYMK